MKKILLALFLIPAISNAQCPPGKYYMPNISSKGVAILADSCYSEADVKGMWAVYFESICGEPVDFVISGYRYSTGKRWNDSLGCVYSEVYEKKVGSTWIQISKCLFYWDNKSRIKCYGGENRDIEIACCGHWHRNKPK